MSATARHRLQTPRCEVSGTGTALPPPHTSQHIDSLADQEQTTCHAARASSQSTWCESHVSISPTRVGIPSCAHTCSACAGCPPPRLPNSALRRAINTLTEGACQRSSRTTPRPDAEPAHVSSRFLTWCTTGPELLAAPAARATGATRGGALRETTEAACSGKELGICPSLESNSLRHSATRAANSAPTNPRPSSSTAVT